MWGHRDISRGGVSCCSSLVKFGRGVIGKVKCQSKIVGQEVGEGGMGDCLGEFE